MTEPILTLRGELVGLGPHSRALIPTWTRPMNDLEDALATEFASPVARRRVMPDA